MAFLEDMTWREYQDLVRAEARETGTPAFGTFELTPLCNFNCKMCYVHLSPERMAQIGRLRSAAEWIDMADQAQRMGMVGVTLTGGEVFTRPDFREIYTGITDLGLIVSVLSNGSLIDKEIVELFRRRPPAYLRFTLYGASNETYERLCGVSDGFDRVMRGLQLLKDADVDFMLSFTETSLNIDDFDDVLRVAEDLDTAIVVGTEIVPAVRGAQNDADALRTDTPRLPPEKKIDGKPVTRPYPTKRTIETPGDDAFLKCKSYRNSFWIDWNGSMEACSFMSSCSVDPFETGFSRAWVDLLDKLARIRLPMRCRGCSYRDFCFSCPGVREAETGSAEVICERLCDKAKSLAERLSSLKKGEMHDEEDVCSARDEALCD